LTFVGLNPLPAAVRPNPLLLQREGGIKVEDSPLEREMS